MKLLMHICCGPCSAAPVKLLREENIDVTGYFYNPNIHPYEEYNNRLNALKEYSKMINLNVIYDEYYGLREFVKNVYDKLDNRCNYCYRSRLEHVVKYAKENNYDAFTTSLLVSPYQKHKMIKQICEDLSKEYEIDFYYKDFRPYFKVGQSMFRETGLYMQKYCGCVFSEEERFKNISEIMEEKIDFINVENPINIKKIKDSREKYLSMLLDADPSEKVVRKYLNEGDLFELTYKNELAGVAIVIKENDEIVELKNMDVIEKYRGLGLGKHMLKYLADTYKTKYKCMIVGTTENNIPFYVKQGFDKYYKTIKNFFLDNYEEKLMDGNLECIDIYYYIKDLNKSIKK